MGDKHKPIGVFDSGIGGITVLKQAVKLLPNEDFIYYGDSKNAPYGVKSKEHIKELVKLDMKFLLSKNVKAVIVACNTATSVAIEDLREKYDMPIIGIEPALKPAVEEYRGEKIVIMATPVTLKEKKFNNLMNKYKDEAEIIPMHCEGLAELIESWNMDSIREYIKNKFSKLDTKNVKAIVLGCTHYPLIKDEIADIVGGNVKIIDGSLGTAKQVKRQLIRNELMNDKIKKGKVVIYNSLQDDNIINFCYRLIL